MFVNERTNELNISYRNKYARCSLLLRFSFSLPLFSLSLSLSISSSLDKDCQMNEQRVRQA